MQALPKITHEDEAGPLTPSPIFDNLIEYKIMGRATCNPIAVIDGYMGEDVTHLVFTVSDVLFEIAKREMHGDSTLVASIIVEDLKKNRQCNCHVSKQPPESGQVFAEEAPVHYFAPVSLGSEP